MLSIHRKTHYACFDCCISLKKHWGEHICPNCRSPLAEMGLNFKAPRREDKRQWRKVRMLYRMGIIFNEDNRRGKKIRTLRDVKELRQGMQYTPREIKELLQFLNAARTAQSRRG